MKRDNQRHICDFSPNFGQIKTNCELAILRSLVCEFACSGLTLFAAYLEKVYAKQAFVRQRRRRRQILSSKHLSECILNRAKHKQEEEENISRKSDDDEDDSLDRFNKLKKASLDLFRGLVSRKAAHIEQGSFPEAFISHFEVKAFDLASYSTPKLWLLKP